MRDGSSFDIVLSSSIHDNPHMHSSFVAAGDIRIQVGPGNSIQDTDYTGCRSPECLLQQHPELKLDRFECTVVVESGMRQWVQQPQ